MSEGDRKNDERDEQEQQARTSRESGGDAEAAAPIEDREAVATDTDDPHADGAEE